MIIRFYKWLLVALGFLFGFIALGAAQYGWDSSVTRVLSISIVCFVCAYILNLIQIIIRRNPSGSAVVALKNFDENFSHNRRGSFFKRLDEDE